MLAEIGDGLIQFALLQKPGFADQPLARTEPAVDRTLIRDHQQHAVRIAMDQVRYGTVGVFFQGIVGRVEVVHLNGIRHHLFPDRVARLLDRGEHRGRDPHGVRADDLLDLFGIHAEVFRQILGFGDALGQDTFPIIHRHAS